MAAREVIVATVRDFLEKIQQLNLEKEGLETANPTKASYLQSQIWKKFTIIDSLMDSCPEAKEVLERDILRRRKEFKAEAKDLRLARITKGVTAKMVQGWLDAEVWGEGPFEYLRLPPEVRREILGYLDCHTDQLNMGEVFPGDGEMMGWNKISLQFEKVLSILMSRKVLTYVDIKSLILAGDYLQMAASNWFEADSEEFFTTINTYMYTSTRNFRALEKVTSDEFPLNPIPVCVQMSANNNQQNRDLNRRKENQLQILRQMGHHIWDCLIEIVGMTMMQSMTQIKEYLALMPNVKYVDLQIYECSDDLNPPANDISYFEDVDLPDLPNLRGLKLGPIRCCAFATKLLRKYGSCLTHLQTTHLHLAPPEDALLFPKLTVMDLQLRYYGDVPPMLAIAQLGYLAGSPLKVVRFNVLFDERIPEYFRNLLCCLNQFGGTLEELDLAFPEEYVSDSERAGDLSWLGNIEFPKVKKLTVRNHPDNWNFLLHFPTLETLSWKYSPGSGEESFAPSTHFNLSWRKRQICKSSLWKMLPFLKSIELRSYSYGYRRIIRTRSESLAYQQKYRRPIRKNKAERRQENENGD